ncbi:aminomethyl-transferring glycine dehydrogenase subunit GcvPA, partial [bacterium]|nr:aminomethyl-transferring glycine dehydrogenase subunit GcvPA [candidate division CSSED10-310 bacterium]
MKRYIPHTARDIRAMTHRIGIDSVDELFADIPASLRCDGDLELPGALSEPELLDLMRTLADANTSDNRRCFIGGGAYNHVIPAIIPYLTQRGEFLTAYTPYQPEVSQGTLQAIFEFQTLICQLTGMDVANASMYDGASALAEAVLMARRLTGRSKVVVAGALHPFYLSVIRTYTRFLGLEINALPLGDGLTDPNDLRNLVGDDTAAFVVQNPNFIGRIEALDELKKAIEPSGAMCIVAVAEAVSLGLLKPPGDCGADIVVGEAQSFGMPVSFGGPYAGFFATRDDRTFLRAMPGRICGQTIDTQGRRGFVLTLSTREQHIRRERATSNICTNQALCALVASIYLSTMGRRGLRRIAEYNLKKAHYASRLLTQIPGCELAHNDPFFNEFVLRTPHPAHLVLERLQDRGF